MDFACDYDGWDIEAINREAAELLWLKALWLEACAAGWRPTADQVERAHAWPWRRLTGVWLSDVRSEDLLATDPPSEEDAEQARRLAREHGWLVGNEWRWDNDDGRTS